MRRLSAIASTAFFAVFALGLCVQSTRADSFAAACAALAGPAAGQSEITLAEFTPAGKVAALPVPLDVPPHCLVRGALNRRVGLDGKPYAIGFELRLPETWNGRFVFQGGGGTDGVLRPAISGVLPNLGNQLMRGYAIVSTDSGHLDEPGALGPYLFGLDPQSRLDNGYAHIPPVANEAKRLIGLLYGHAPDKSYLVGCSNGGRQGMMATQRFPDLFDGVLAVAPAYRVSQAAIDAAANTKAFASVAPAGADGVPDLGAAFSPADMKLVADAVLEACDAKDGAKDGMVNDMKGCTFDPAVLACHDGRNSACLAPNKVSALDRVFKGTRDGKGAPIYVPWPYDPGVAAAGWRAWRLGTPGKSPPDARDTSLIAGGLAYFFETPPEKPSDLYRFTLGFDVDDALTKTRAVAAPFNEPATTFVDATSTDITKFVDKGGKLLLFHGTADPIFSPYDTIRYLDGLHAAYGAKADDFSRLYLIPGMNHCIGGPATDQFDGLQALVDWVEKGVRPTAILATARPTPDVPWPGRTRPLCPYPQKATYNGTGDMEVASSFSCR